MASTVSRRISPLANITPTSLAPRASGRDRWLIRHHLAGTADARGLPPAAGATGGALISAAIDAYDRHREAERGCFLASAAGGQPQTDMALGHRIDLLLGGASYPFEVYQIGAHRYRLLVDGSRIEAEKEAEVAGEFDRIHSIERARRVGSVDRIISPGSCAAASSSRR